MVDDPSSAAGNFVKTSCVVRNVSYTGSDACLGVTSGLRSVVCYRIHVLHGEGSDATHGVLYSDVDQLERNPEVRSVAFAHAFVSFS